MFTEDLLDMRLENFQLSVFDEVYWVIYKSEMAH